MAQDVSIQSLKLQGFILGLNGLVVPSGNVSIQSLKLQGFIRNHGFLFA